MKISKCDSVIVFDLDDTLYKEADYEASGIRAVSNLIMDLYGADAHRLLQNISTSGKKSDLLGDFCEAFNLPLTVKDSLLWCYRLHQPNIELVPEISSFIEELESAGAQICILTDGRSVTQKLKLKSLGLSRIPAFISEEYGNCKPDPQRFSLIQTTYHSKTYIYIGDNPKKDFLAPNQLGWVTFGLIGDDRNIHPQEISGLSNEFLPHFWLNRLVQLDEFLC